MVDAKDIRILNELTKNCKVSLRKLSQKVSVSLVTLMKRIKNLEKEKIISSYNIGIDYDKLGYDTHVLIDVKISKGKLLELEKKIAKSPNVYAVFDTTGNFDAVIIARFKCTRSLDKFLKTIQTYDFIQSTRTRLILNTIKNSSISIR